MEKTINLEFFIVSFNGFCIYFWLELLLREILLIVRNFSHSKESDSYHTSVCNTHQLSLEVMSDYTLKELQLVCFGI